MNKAAILLISLGLLSSCASDSKKSDVEISKIDDEITEIGKSNSKLPYLFKDNEGQIYLSWVEEAGDTVRFYYSELSANGAWNNTLLIAEGTDWFVNWADYPMLATKTGKTVIAHYLSKSGEDTFSYDVSIKTSNNEGETWDKSVVLHDDGKEAEHGFVSMIPYNENFFICWLDGRNTSMEEGAYGAMTIRGAIVSPKGEKLKVWELDDRVCDCCQTGAAMTLEGPIVVYRNRSEEEIRDMYITRLVEDQWTKPMAIHNDNWKIMGCPVNGPRIVADGLRVAIAWYTASPENSVNVVFSENGGESFSKPIRVNEAESIGRVDVAFTDDQSAFITWMEGGSIVGAAVSENGILKRYKLANSSAARSSGFPQMEIVNKQILVVWTDSEAQKVKTKFIEL